MLTKNDDEMVGLFGRFEDQDAVVVPLKGVRILADVHDFIAEVQVIQCYQNTGTKGTMECTYHFPLDDNAAVCAFQATYQDGTVVRGEVEEKSKATQQYKKAMQEGKQANLLQQVRPDVFTLNVGNLPAGEYVRITITYITTLEARGDDAAFVLPTSIAPRYTPEDVKLAPEEAAALQGGAHFDPLLGLVINANFNCKSPIKYIKSPTHAEGSINKVAGTTGSFQLRDVPLTRDVVILCQEERAHQPRVSMEVAPDGSVVGLVSLFPEIEFQDKPREFIFLLDRSGSMRGWNSGGGKNQIEQAKESLLLFLRALPPNSTFNIVGFGSSFETMYATPQPYNDFTLEDASSKIRSMKADLGGTEILTPLRDVFSKKLARGMERQVFVLTDGQVGNDAAVFDLIRQHCSEPTGAKPCRLFSVGVGARVSRHLCNGMARAGRGTVRYVEEGSSAKLQSSLMGQLKQALQPALHEVSIKWDMPQKPTSDLPPVKTLLGYKSTDVDNHPMEPTRMYPSVNPVVFNKERFLSFAVFPSGCELPKKVTVSCMTEDGLLETTLSVEEDDVFQGSVAHKLAARTAIREYEDRIKDRSSYGGHPVTLYHQRLLSRTEALKMALTNSLASELTSFIAVSEAPCVEPGELAEALRLPQPTGTGPLHDMPHSSHSRGSASPSYRSSSLESASSMYAYSIPRSMQCCEAASAPRQAISLRSSAAPPTGFSGWSLPKIFQNGGMFGGSTPTRSVHENKIQDSLGNTKAMVAAEGGMATLEELERQRHVLSNIQKEIGGVERSESLSCKSKMFYKKKQSGNVFLGLFSAPGQSRKVAAKEKEAAMQVEEAREAAEQEIEAYKSMVAEEKKADKEKQKKACQQQTLIDESAKILEYLRKENMKLSKQNASLRGQDFDESKEAAKDIPPSLDERNKIIANFRQENKELRELNKALRELNKAALKKQSGSNTGPEKANCDSNGKREAFDLCVLQKANGSFELSAKVLEVVAISDDTLAELKAIFSTKANTTSSLNKERQETALATMIAIAAFRVVFSKQRAIWELNEAKALSYLGSINGIHDTETLLSAVEAKLLSV